MACDRGSVGRMFIVGSPRSLIFRLQLFRRRPLLGRMCYGQSYQCLLFFSPLFFLSARRQWRSTRNASCGYALSPTCGQLPWNGSTKSISLSKLDSLDDWSSYLYFFLQWTTWWVFVPKTVTGFWLVSDFQWLYHRRDVWYVFWDIFSHQCPIPVQFFATIDTAFWPFGWTLFPQHGIVFWVDPLYFLFVHLSEGPSRHATYLLFVVAFK